MKASGPASPEESASGRSRTYETFRIVLQRPPRPELAPVGAPGCAAAPQLQMVPKIAEKSSMRQLVHALL
jgi:hypothetical protein